MLIDRICRRHTPVEYASYDSGPGHLSYEQSEIDTEQATVDDEIEPGAWQDLYEVGRQSNGRRADVHRARGSGD